MLNVSPIQTSVFSRSDSLEDFLIENLEGFELEGRILAITSKIVSVAEGQFASAELDKRKLVEQNADLYMGQIAYDCHLTVKHGLLIASAGIDESNSESGNYILYPNDPDQSAQDIHKILTERMGLNNLGILLTDSHTSPLRRGVLGVALAYFGFRGVESKIGCTDIFGRESKMTQINVADALAVAATLTMGETDERCPLAIVDYPVHFCGKDRKGELRINPAEDLYRPLLLKELAQESEV